ncbi:MAG: glycosyltransferase family 4 protein, partial [Nanoarchaeota archaeon]|nr:glycosyltransferase family 4 protein [Nanoarchaeota archaeon]
NGVRIILFPLMKFQVGDYTPPKPDLRVIRKEVKQADIIWSQTIGPIGGACMDLAKRSKKPVIAYIHSVEWELFSKSLKHFRRTVMAASKFFVKNVYNKCDLLLVPSETTKRVLEERGITAKKEVVHLGVDVERFKPSSNKEKAKERVGIQADKIVIGYLGRFGREKNLITLYNAFKSLRDEFPQLELLLVGGEKERLADFLGSTENVKVVEPTDTPELYYQAMDIYVLPSLTETTSLTTLEAMSTEVAVVCTPVGDIPNYVRHKSNGFLFPPESVERLKLVLKMLINDPALRERVGARARKTVTLKHSWKKTAQKLKDIIGRFG